MVTRTAAKTPPRLPVAEAMALGLTRALIANGTLSHDDVVGMIADMERVAAKYRDEMPGGYQGTMKAVRLFRDRLAAEPGITFPLVLTAE